jgi:hypothetical protein
MKPFAVQPDEVTEQDIVGSVLCQDIVAVGELGRVRLGKGRILQAEDLPPLRTYSGEIHLLQLEPDDVHEDEASIRLARAVSGQGVTCRGPVESQTQLRASHKGFLDVRADVLQQLNELPDVSVFTAYDGQPVTANKPIGATKVTPLAVPGSVIARAEEIARDLGPVVQVHPFLGGRVGVVVRDRLAGPAKEKFESAIHMKVGWFGSPVAGIRYLPEDVQAIAAAIDGFVADGVSLILAAGVNSTDPLDLTLQAMDRLGAQTEARGVPAHPGSTCWLAFIGEVPIFGLALCGMFSRTTVLDLLLPRFLSGASVRAADIARLGHGGLLSKDMAFRFPSYALEGD